MITKGDKVTNRGKIIPQDNSPPLIPWEKVAFVFSFTKSQVLLGIFFPVAVSLLNAILFCQPVQSGREKLFVSLPRLRKTLSGFFGGWFDRERVDGGRPLGSIFFPCPRRRKMLPDFFFSSICLSFRYSLQAFSDLKALTGTRAVVNPFSLDSKAILVSRKTSSSFSTRKAQ